MVNDDDNDDNDDDDDDDDDDSNDDDDDDDDDDTIEAPPGLSEFSCTSEYGTCSTSPACSNRESMNTFPCVSNSCQPIIF